MTTEDPNSTLAHALTELRAAEARPYYEEAAEEQARESYYAGLDGGDAAAMASALAALLERTHDRPCHYSPSQFVYPWVDLHPDRLLRSVYSGKTFEPEELIRADAEIERARANRRNQLLASEAMAPEALVAELAAIEAALPYNCEHVVPQSWFGEDEPMRGDLHHLFACESGCNSFRGNSPYVEFPEQAEAFRTECGRLESTGFEPAAGKGPAARATLYFLLRYPGAVGDKEPELTAERLDLLLAWHEQDPVSEYELHRNMAIAGIQGNRNPFIDHPSWAERVDFSSTWAR